VTPAGAEVEKIEEPEASKQPRWQKFTAFCLSLLALVGGLYMTKGSGDNAVIYATFAGSVTALAGASFWANVREHLAKAGGQ